MTKPTQKSRDEVAGHDYDYFAMRDAFALTLDQLHGRVEMSEAEEFYREVVAKQLCHHSFDHELCYTDMSAIALIESKFAELRAAKEPEWIEWNGGACSDVSHWENQRWSAI